jgi:hypothetical protein
MVPTENWGVPPGVGSARRGLEKGGATLSQSGGFARDDRCTDPDICSVN